MAGAVSFVLLLVALFMVVSTMPNTKYDHDDFYMHKHSKHEYDHNKRREGEDTAQFWRDQAQATLSNKLVNMQQNTNIAKNVILFMGDGMSIPTLMASRVWMAQKAGLENGEENSLSFEQFPYTGLSKTYCVDAQVADSACAATAYLCGVKANDGTLGVTAAVSLGDCQASLNTDNHVDSIVAWSQAKGKKTGFVTTTRVTHASPAGTYAHTADRDWENNVQADDDCDDIGHQLIYGDVGRKLNVIMGGGRKHMLTTNDIDPEDGTPGKRTDENLIERWTQLKQGKTARYVYTRNDLLAIPDNTEYVLGLYEADHLRYDMSRDKKTEPSLSEMVENAIRLLDTSEQGFFLFVEGGRIDHAHHDSRAKKALDETVALSDAVKRALELTTSDNTLIVVTSDHAHTMSVAGYPVRGNDILGQPADIALDDIPYSTITYANGPGYRKDKNGDRYDISKHDTHDKDFDFPSIAELDSETHGGDDVAIFAYGPWAHLFSGSMEENVLPHLMAFASCVGDGATACDGL